MQMNLLADPTLLYGGGDSVRAITRLLLEALPSGALIVDHHGRVTALNTQAELLLGWGMPALEGQSAHEFLECRVEEGQNTSDNCPIGRVLRGGSVEPARAWIRCRDESLKAIEYHCVPYPTLRGLGAILTFRDLTRQMELEKDLRRLATIAEESPIAIVEINEDANLLHANPAMMCLVERFGFTSAARPAVLPSNIETLTAQCLRAQTEVGGIIEVSIGGNHYEWKLVPVKQEQLVRGYGIDVTVRKRVEIELVEAKARAEVASRAKSEFLANVSDELCSPITDILKMAESLAEGCLSDPQLEYVKTVQSCAQSLATVVDDILDMGALETGELAREIIPFDFRAFMDETAAPFIRCAEEKGLQLTIAIADRVPLRVQSDHKRLKQVLDKLLSNAIKFTESGEVTVEVDRDTISTHRYRRDGESKNDIDADNTFYVFFAVRDTGIGIAAEKQMEIFERFSQADGSSAKRYGGTGLGLAIAKHLVEQMEGKIGVESDLGRGSRFWFIWPVQQEAEQAE